MEKNLKIIIVTGLLLMLPLAIGAQSIGVSSLLSSSSDGLFTNELDAAESVIEMGSGPGFSELSKTYIFGGISNLNSVDNTGTFNPLLTIPPTPLYLGVYFPGSMPVSIFTGIYLEGGSDTKDQISTTNPIKSVTVGTTTTNYTWVSQRTTDTHQVPVLDKHDLRLQFLTRLANINLGLFLSLKADNTPTDPANNYTQVIHDYYDPAAVGAAPNPTLSQTRTNTFIDKGGATSEVAFNIPLFFDFGGLKQYLQPYVSIGATDNSTGLTRTSTNPEDPNAGVPSFPIVNDEKTETEQSVKFGLNSVTYIDGILGADERNQFFFGASFEMTMKSEVYDQSDSTRTDTWDGTTLTEGTTTASTDVREFEQGLGISLAGSVNHSFYFTPVEMLELAILPAIAVSYSQTAPDARVVSKTTTNVITDNTGTKTTDERSVITTTYADTGKSTETMVSTTLYSAVTVKPKDWPFWFTFSGSPQVSLTSTWTPNYGQAFSQQTTTFTDSITPANDTVTTNSFGNTSNITGTINHNWDVTADYNFGLTIPINESSRIEIDLGGVDLFNFDNLTMQVIIGL
jgi:hypothetical protein